MSKRMKLNNIHGFGSIDDYVKFKIAEYGDKEKNFETLFDFMFYETDNIIAEFSDGYRITKITYGEFKKKILDITPTVMKVLSDVPEGEMVGFCFSNCIEWIQIFWAILAAGYSPLIMNTRLPDEVLEEILSDHSVKCVISDEKVFSVKTVLKEDVLAPSDSEYVKRAFGKEVLFMSSGTTDNVKLCAYNGENFYYQICDSEKVIRQCPKIKQHYEGELKQLILLPLCHVFGFIAVYLWFGFFSRTFVFPRDLNPDTIRRTVKKHKVTHIFAVPMVWEAIHKAVIRSIKERGKSTYSKFSRVSGLVNKLPVGGDFIAGHLLSEVRDGLFGDSICFLISGGSHIKPETLRFFNGIGYHLVNGYGMTEIGITSVEKTSKRSIANKGSIGAPLGFTEYSINDEGRLLVKGKTRASRIICGQTAVVTDYNEWFNTGDIMRNEGGRYFFDGRADDLIVGADGENLNPTIAERQLQTSGVDSLCIFLGKDGVTLVASVPGIFSDTALKAIYSSLNLRINEAKLGGVIRRIVFTHEPLLRPGEFKLNRKKIAERLDIGEIRAFDPVRIDEHIEELSNGLEAEIASYFAEVLGKDIKEIGVSADFFRDLGGTSLDYFALLGMIKTRLGTDIMSDSNEKISTVKGFAQYIKKI